MQQVEGVLLGGTVRPVSGCWRRVISSRVTKARWSMSVPKLCPTSLSVSAGRPCAARRATAWWGAMKSWWLGGCSSVEHSGAQAWRGSHTS